MFHNSHVIINRKIVNIMIKNTNTIMTIALKRVVIMLHSASEATALWRYISLLIIIIIIIIIIIKW